MTIREKIGKGVDNVKDKTTGFFDATALRVKINDEKEMIEDETFKLGSHYLSKQRKGEKLDDTAMNIVKRIEASEERIKKYEAELKGQDK